MDMMLREQKEERASGQALQRSLGLTDVIAYGIGSTVGAGLFVVTGKAAKDFAGPAVSLSFAVAAIACLFSAFCYAEFAARVPVNGSAYSFAYATLGEGLAWFIGWNLTLEYGISAAAIARGWSNYLVQFLMAMGLKPPTWLYDIPLGWPPLFKSASPLAGLIVFACTLLLLRGATASAKVNFFVTCGNLVLVGFIVIAGSTKIEPANWQPFAPNGLRGILAGGGFVFFSFIGFDCVCTLSEELKNPQRDLPRGIVGTLVIVTVLYIIVALVLTGMVPLAAIDVNAPLSSAFLSVDMKWASAIVAFGSASTLTATTLCSLFGQPRIFYRMAKDGLLFQAFGTLSEKAKVPEFGTIVTGAGAGLLALLLDIDVLTDMISIGTLLAFTVVCVSILVLRYERSTEDGSSGTSSDSTARPEEGAASAENLAYWYVAYFLLAAVAFNASWASVSLGHFQFAFLTVFALVLVSCTHKLAKIEQANFAASFRCPLVPWFPCIGIIFNINLIFGLPASSFFRLCVWSILGLGIYLMYGMTHSSLENLRPYGLVASETDMFVDNEDNTYPDGKAGESGVNTATANAVEDDDAGTAV